MLNRNLHNYLLIDKKYQDYTSYYNYLNSSPLTFICSLTTTLAQCRKDS